MKTGFFMLVGILAFVVACIPVITSAQLRKPLPDITEAMNSEYRQLKEKYSANKKIPSILEKQVLFALSYFPELQHTKIKIKLKKNNSGIISTRPTLGSIFRRSSKRSYIVIINDSARGRVFPLFMNGGVNGQVGILGHEFCHILYFNKKTGLGLIGLGINHISKKYMDHFENKTDSVDIERGLGYQLIDWKQYLDKEFRKIVGLQEDLPFEKTGTRERYMSVEHIRKVMANSSAYR